jgi:hypothetical protein
MTSCKIEPVKDRDGRIIVYDIFILNESGTKTWIGSKRTYKQCIEIIGEGANVGC